MEKQNTVTIDLHEYNQLRDFRKGITEGQIVSISCYGRSVYYLEKDEVIEELSSINSKLEEKLRNEGKAMQEVIYEDIKYKMNVFQVIYWKLFKNKY